MCASQLNALLCMPIISSDRRSRGGPVKRLLRVALPPLATLVLGLFIGFALGQRWGLQWVESEVFGNLSLRVEAASRIRIGEPEVALRLIDGAIDRALLVAVARYDDLKSESHSSVRSGSTIVGFGMR